MKITFDPKKDEANQEKHGISLVEAVNFDWDSVRVCVDDRKDYGEIREIALGIIGSQLYCAVFVQRSETLRIISLRKANRKEVLAYVEALEHYSANA